MCGLCSSYDVSPEDETCPVWFVVGGHGGLPAPPDDGYHGALPPSPAVLMCRGIPLHVKSWGPQEACFGVEGVDVWGSGLRCKASPTAVAMAKCGMCCGAVWRRVCSTCGAGAVCGGGEGGEG